MTFVKGKKQGGKGGSQMVGLRGSNKKMPGISFRHFEIESDARIQLIPYKVYEPPVPKTAKGYYYYHDKKIAITLLYLSSPFRKGGRESPPLLVSLVGT
jgi:hypothetical protein